MRATLKLLRRIFPFRGEKDSSHEIVFPHPLFSGAEKHASPDHRQSQHPQLNPHVYQENIKHIISFLDGRRQEIIKTLQEGMKQAASEHHFERAGIFRDQLRAIERLEGWQKVYLPTKESFDVISVAGEKHRSAANVFQIRNGKLLGKHTFLLRHRSTASSEDTLRQFLLQYYGVAQNMPKRILLPLTLPDQDVIARWVCAGDPPTFAVPRRGKKHQLLLMGHINASQLLDQQKAAFTNIRQLRQAQAELLKTIGLTNLLTKQSIRIETYD
ncbi:MAG: UvrB/UvrC motif-containing protein, partial [Candidatus Binatia bacterium]